MSSLRRLLLRLYHVLRPGSGEAELDRELRSHLTLLEDEYASRGLAPEAARLAARRALGGAAQVTDLHREARSLRWLEDLQSDLLYGLRTLRRTPAVTLVIVLTLALGIGSTTALFSAVNGLLLESVPVPRPADLVRIRWAGDNDMKNSWSDYGTSLPDRGRKVGATFSFSIYQQLRTANRTMTDLTAFASAGRFDVVTDGQADLASAFEVAGNYFHMLEVNAALGRTITESDDTLLASPVAVISDAFWRRRFGRDRDVLGRVVTMNGQRVTIVGVTAPDFTGVLHLATTAPDITVPLAFDSVFRRDTHELTEPTNWWLLLMGRLKPGASIEQVYGNLIGPYEAAARAGRASYDASLGSTARTSSEYRNRGTAVPQLLLSSGRHGVYDVGTETTQEASFLAVVVAILLVIVCANVANLLLSRATARRREISIRLSMGATRARLVRQLLTESVFLSGLGGISGLVVGYWSRALLPFGKTAPVDWSVAVFTGGLSVLTGLVFGLVPALRATQVDLAEATKATSRSVISSRSWLAKGLLVTQVALSLVLIFGAGLFLRTLDNLRRVDVGFDTSNLLMFRLNPQLLGYDEPRSSALYDGIHDRIAALPGVRSVALTATLLLSGSTSADSIWAEGRPGDQPTIPDMYRMEVSADYFDTMGIRLVRGRLLTDHDTSRSPTVAVVNETAARGLFPDGEPIGRHVGESKENDGDTEIVGVVRDTKYNSVRDLPPPTIFRSYRQKSSQEGMAFVVRTSGDPNALSESIRAAVHQVEPTLPIPGFTTQAAELEGRLERERLFALAYSLFGGLALLLACIGLFGLMSYDVARRTTEIGIRMALGAQRRTVVQMVLGESLALVGTGVTLGLGTVIAMGHLVAAVLYGLTPTDTLTTMGTVGLVVAVSLVAVYLPARRASLVSPLVALRES